MHLIGFPDHAVLKVSVSFKKPSDSSDAFIPDAILKHKMFTTFHEQLCWETNLGAFRDPWLKLDFHKSINRAAGQFVKEYIQDTNENTPFAKVMSLSTLAKVIWTQSFTLASNLLEYSQLAKAHIAIGESEITIRSHTEFTTTYEKAKSDLLSQQTKENDLKKPSPRKDEFSSNLSRLTELWIPFGKKLVLEGVIVSGNSIFNEPQKTLALGAAWQDTFNAKPFDLEK